MSEALWWMVFFIASYQPVPFVWQRAAGESKAVPGSRALQGDPSAALVARLPRAGMGEPVGLEERGMRIPIATRLSPGHDRGGICGLKGRDT